MRAQQWRFTRQPERKATREFETDPLPWLRPIIEGKAQAWKGHERADYRRAVVARCARWIVGLLLPCFLHLLRHERVRVGDDIYSVPAVAFDAVERVVGHLA